MDRQGSMCGCCAATCDLGQELNIERFARRQRADKRVDAIAEGRAKALFIDYFVFPIRSPVMLRSAPAGNGSGAAIDRSAHGSGGPRPRENGGRSCANKNDGSVERRFRRWRS